MKTLKQPKPMCNSGIKLLFLFLFAQAAYMPAQAQLKGTYTIDPGKSASSTNYQTIHSAITDLDSGKRYDGGTSNGKGVGGAVIFKIANGTYVGQNIIAAIPGSSTTNTVTFTSASGDSSKVILTSTLVGNPGVMQGTLSISGASNISLTHITVSVSSGSSSNEMACIYMVHASSHIHISNCMIRGTQNYLVSGITSNLDGNIADSDKVIYQNHFDSCGFGDIVLSANGYANKACIDEATKIEKNIGSNYNGGYFLTAQFQNHITVDKNIGRPFDIVIKRCDNILSISGNKGNASVSIDSCAGDQAAPALISDNALISSYVVVGITNSSYINIYYNNIYIYGTIKGFWSTAFQFANDAKLRFENNAIGSVGTGGSNSGGQYGILIDDAKALISCDYNDYYYKDSIATLGGKEIGTLADWQAATGFDKHSLDVDPLFDQSNYLYTRNTTLAGKGTPLSTVPYDILGVARNKTAPSIGAYELAPIGVCKGNCVTFFAPVNGRKYHWSTGDTTATIIFCPSKSGSISGVIWTGTSTADTTTVSFTQYFTVSTCVWPGDANDDLKDNIYDVLAVGAAYADTGAMRINATINWTPQVCNDWAKSFKSGVNHKFADCNGDGKVDSADLHAIKFNFGKTHSKTAAAASGFASNPALAIAFSNDSASAGDTAQAVISLGTSALQASNIYGIAFSIDYGGEVSAKGITADFSKCWLGTLNKNLISMVVDDTANEVLYIALTRTDHTNVSGYGEIGRLSIMMPDNVAGKREVKQMFRTSFLDYLSINAAEDTLYLNPVGDSVQVYEYKSGIEQTNPIGFNVMAFPNPVTNVMHLKTAGALINEVSVADITGKEIFSTGFSNTAEADLPTESLAPGIYLANIKTNIGQVVIRIQKE